MPSRRTTLLIFSALAAATLIFWLLSGDRQQSEDSPRIHDQRDASHLARQQQRDGTRQEHNADASERDHPSSAPPADSPESYDAYLRHNRFSADAYAAVFDLTVDEALLKEALARFPESGALLARGAWLSTDPAFALQCAQSLRRVEPEGSLGDYLTAMLMVKQGSEPAEIKEVLAAALTKGPPESYDRNAISDRREALEAIGTPDYDARLDSLFGPVALDGSCTLLMSSTEEMIASGDPMLVEAGIAMTQHFLYRPGIAIITQIAAAKSQLNLLSAMQPDYEFGDSGKSLEERKSELHQQLNELCVAVDLSISETAKMTRSEKISLADSIMQKGEYKAIMESFLENQ